MSTSSHDECPRIGDAGAYLVGALSPAERAGYAAHLPGCAECLGEVGQLAGLPGLLARSHETGPAGGRPVEAGPGEASADAADPVSGALARIRRQRARSRSWMAAALVTVALVGIGGTAAVSGTFAAPRTGVFAAAKLPVPMRPMGGARATAALSVTDRPWGTEVVMRCRYQGSTEYGPPVYVLVARATDGSIRELARWTAMPDEDIVLSGTTELNRRQLAGLEVRDTKGRVVLEAQPV